jgi:hypothetical protein
MGRVDTAPRGRVLNFCEHAKILLVLLVVLVGMFGYLNFKIGEVEDLQDHTHVCRVQDPFAYYPSVFCP